MAEVAGAVMGGIGNIAMAAAAISVASIAYAIFQQVWKLIPWAGSAMMGASWALMFAHIDPMLAMGGALGLAAFIYPALEIFTAVTTASTSKPMPMPVAGDIAKSMVGIAAIMGAGFIGGVTHVATQSLPGSLVAAAAAGFLASKYAAGPLINFYLEIGFMQNLACGAGGSNPANCIAPCTKASLKNEYAVWLGGAGAGCTHGSVDPAWCQAWKDYYSVCSWQRSKAPDATPGASGGSARPSPACAKAGLYREYGPPKFENVCTNTPFKISVYPGDMNELWRFPPIPIDPDKWAKYDPNGEVVMVGPGLGCYKGPAGTSFAPAFNATHGHIKSCADGVLTCMYEGSRGNWQLGDGLEAGTDSDNKPYSNFASAAKLDIIGTVSAQGTSPTAVYGFVNYDLGDPKNAEISKRAGAFAGQNVCIASTKTTDHLGNPKFIAHTDKMGAIQPLDANQPSFCGSFNKQAAKAGDYTLARVYPYTGQDGERRYQCKPSESSGLLPQTPLPWPK